MRRGGYEQRSLLHRFRASSVGLPTCVAAVLALVILIGAILLIISVDPADNRLAGDEASFVMNALSLEGGNLSYDAEDHERWLDLGWTDQPAGLFLRQNEHGWAFAKPYGYSVALSPAIAVFGLRGVTVVGALLVIAYAACWFLLGRLRWSTAVSAIVSVAATIFSNVWFYAFPAHADLFVATLVGVVALGSAYARVRGSSGLYFVAAVAAGLLIEEKVPALLSLLPLLVVGAWRFSRRTQLIAAGLFIVVAVLSVAPNLYYSDGQSWSAYGGDRYYAGGPTPWSGGSSSDLIPLTSGELVTPGYVLERLRHPSGDLPEAASSYLVGRHTGVLTFMPIVPALLLAAATVVVRRRCLRRAVAGSDSQRGDPDGVATGPGANGSPSVSDDVESARDRFSVYGQKGGAPVVDLLAAAVASLVLYISFYLVLFTNNYYGGAQSIGSRYFVQFSIVAVVVPVAAGVSERIAVACAAFAVMWALVVLWPHFESPDKAFLEVWKTSWAQRQLPFDSTQYNEGLWP
jgi:hypothetical protein